MLPKKACLWRPFMALTEGLLSSFRENQDYHRIFRDTRIQNFIDDYLKDLHFDKPCRLPDATLVLNQPGMAREVSLPANGDIFKSKLLTSYRLEQGILNNPASDKRTTEGTFHIVDGGLPVAIDKKEVPKIAFACCMRRCILPGR